VVYFLFRVAQTSTDSLISEIEALLVSQLFRNLIQHEEKKSFCLFVYIWQRQEFFALYWNADLFIKSYSFLCLVKNQVWFVCKVILLYCPFEELCGNKVFFFAEKIKHACIFDNRWISKMLWFPFFIQRENRNCNTLLVDNWTS